MNLTGSKPPPLPLWKKTAGKSHTAWFAELVAIEPRLEALLNEATAYNRTSRRKSRVCANDRWYGYNEWKGKGLKRQLCWLVGDKAQNAKLRTADAYDVAYDHIYAALPDCRNCGCVSLEALLSL